MNKFLILFIALSNFAFAQQKSNPGLWHLTVADSITAKGIEKATITIGKKKVLSTDVNGVIDIDQSIIGPKDSIRISSVGYLPVLLKPSSNHRFPDTIRLSRSVTSLMQVSISSSPTIKLGNVKTRYDTPMHPLPDHEFAQYMPNDERITGTITSVEFELNDDLHAIDKPFNIELLSRSSDSIFPDTALIKDSIIVYNPEKKHHITVDVSKYNIPIPENGFFVVFQTLPASYYSQQQLWFEGHHYVKTPGINIYLKEKYKFEGECCGIEKPELKGYYCLLGSNRNHWQDFEKRDQWIVYAQGINFAIGATITR